MISLFGQAHTRVNIPRLLLQLLSLSFSPFSSSPLNENYLFFRLLNSQVPETFPCHHYHSVLAPLFSSWDPRYTMEEALKLKGCVSSLTCN